MTAQDTPANLTEALLAGPRGRRLLLEYAHIADNRTRDGHTQDSVSSGVFYATYRIDVARGTAGVLYGPGADRPLPNISPAT